MTDSPAPHRSASPHDTAPVFVHYHLLDVFTGTRFGGNPLAVVLHGADGLDDAALQRIAREFNLSETTFVFPPTVPSHTRRVRIFTPARELPFAGHPTVGTAIALALAGEVPMPAEGEAVQTLELGVGPTRVVVRAHDGLARWAQLAVAKLPEEGAPLDRAIVRDALGLADDDLLPADTHPPAVSSCGTPFLMVPLATRDALRRAAIQPATWSAHLEHTDASFVCVFTADDAGEGFDLAARVFVPSDGIAEDPATGSAIAALGGYLARRTPRTTGTLRWLVSQGTEMGRPSRLELEVDKTDGTITAVRVAGNAVWMGEGRLRVV